MMTPPRSEIQGPTGERRTGRKAIAGVALFGALASAVLLAWLPTPAQAHSDLVSSDPVAGSSLAASPLKLVLTFSDGVAPRYTVVTLRVGTAEVASLKATVIADRVTATVPANVHGTGLWRVAYRVVSADGHSVAGQIVFTVKPTPSLSGVPTPDDQASVSQPSGERASAADDGVLVESPRSTNNRSGLHPGLSVLIIALLVSAPVVVFVVIASRKRREDSRGPRL